MTDNDIVKALKELFELMLCEGDLQRSATISKAFYLIKRQQAEIVMEQKHADCLNAEIERLKEVKEHITFLIDSRGYECPTSEIYNEDFQKTLKHLHDNINIKAEAYKEFAEKAKNEILNRLIKKSQAVKERSEKYNINTEGDVVSLIYNSEIIALNDAIEIIDSLKLNKKKRGNIRWKM